jgi:F-type H+-transporting ATPase subunit delta
MNQSKISVRYAKALFELALEKDKLDIVHTDISLINQVLKDYPQFGAYLKSPVVRPSQKLASTREAFSGNIADITLNFVLLLIGNKREAHLEDIIRRFFDVYREYKGIKSVTIITAVPLSSALRDKFHGLLSSIYKKGIELQEQHDPAVIGGFVLKVGDQQYDASVANGLKKMKTVLLTESIK